VNVTTYTPPADIDARRTRALIVGVVGLAVCAAGFAMDRDQFFRAWLIAYLLWLGVALGSMGFMMVHHLSGGGWGLVVRRVFEASSRTLPLLSVLFIPIVLGMNTLYPWMHPDTVQADAVLRHRAVYLNFQFFVIRAVIYFAGWNFLAWRLNALSRAQDGGDIEATRTMQRVSGGGLVFYAISVMFACVDWVMSINPHFYSTIWGFLFLGSHGLSALAFTIIVARFLSQREPMSGVLKAHHFHDLGKFSLAFVMLWAYFNFSQYLLVYSANLVEEVPYFITRISNGWQYLALFLFLFQFAVPFSLLLSRDLKRSSNRLVMVAAWIIFMRFLDMFMLVSPEFSPQGANLHIGGAEHVSAFFIHWMDLAAPLGIGGVWLWMFWSQLRQRPLLPVGDPYLQDALESSGGH